MSNVIKTSLSTSQLSGNRFGVNIVEIDLELIYYIINNILWEYLNHNAICAKWVLWQRVKANLLVAKWEREVVNEEFYILDRPICDYYELLILVKKSLLTTDF